jgi:hypothetical protein
MHFPLYIELIFSYLCHRCKRYTSWQNSLKERASCSGLWLNHFAVQVVNQGHRMPSRLPFSEYPYQNENDRRENAKRDFQTDKRG